MPSMLKREKMYVSKYKFRGFLPAAIPPRIVATIGVCKRGCIHDINRNINPSAAIAYKTRGNGNNEPSNEANIPLKKVKMFLK